MKELLTRFVPKLVGYALNVYAIVAPNAAARKALDIFSTPRKGRIQSHQRKFLKKFQSRSLPFEGTEIMTYHHKGKGKRVLLCHGWESNTFRWRKLFKTLAANDIDIVSMDGPAHGQTGSDRFTAIIYADMMKTVIDTYQPEIIIGHSIGGLSAIMCLQQYAPASIKKAIIMASPDRMEDITNNYFKIIGGSKRLRTYYERLVPQKFGHPSSYYSGASFAKAITIPALIIHDASDDINRVDEGQRIHQAWSGSQLHITDGYGHSLQDAEVYNLVADYITV